MSAPSPHLPEHWSTLLGVDREHVWHPYGPMPGARAPLPVVRAEGVRLELADGRKLIDGMASWWAAIHGYRHPVIDAAAHEQIDRMSHVMFGGLTHEPGVRLAQRLVEMTPDGLDHVFFADSGSVAMEVAIKVCLQANRGRTRLLAFEGGYHGDTFGAMSVTDPIGGMHARFADVLPGHVFAPRPPAVLDEEYEATLRALFEQHGETLAAAVIEPIVQGTGGMWFYDPAVLVLLRELCDEYGVFLVFDEIATGFGRTGVMFAAEHAGIVPDVMCVGKALTGGYVTLAAMLCRPRVVDALAEEALMHGPTFMANPLACSIALASTGLLLDGSWKGDIDRISRVLNEALAPARELGTVAAVRVLGGIGVIEMHGPVDLGAATAAAVAAGVWLRPFGNLIYTMPPYPTVTADLEAIGTAAVAAATAI
ncbi:MAG TPA: adenosylmethionine--8-amino-7-oxononanoate transaminase [Baekduia sp.]|nr:adenosylmethionine--8-amino-7-oxononanoate transaminase [Baekduia sp.]